MPIRVLIVDDSGFFRRRVAEMLNSDPRLEVVDTAADGAEAVAKNASLRPDVITMDIEMPVMDGITAVRRIMSSGHPAPVLMFSSLTTDGAKATLDALEAGAVDYLPKKFEDISLDREEARRLLCEKVHAVGKGGRARATAAARPVPRPAPSPSLRTPVPTGAHERPRLSKAPAPAAAPRRGGPLSILGIGTSTGGPVALQEVLTKLPANFPLPIVLVQHMPGSFTPAFAQRLDQQCAISVREARDGDTLEPGLALLAPGGKQMQVERRGTRATVRIEEPEPGQNYKPSVDVTFSSIARAFPGQALGVILTGMGADGREGARLMKSGGSSIWAQDEATSVVYGMPAAVAEAGISEQSLPLAEIGSAIARRVM